MVTLLPWSSIEIGDLDIFALAPPCLLVHTSYIDGEPESSVTYFWQDETTGLLNHEVLFLRAADFDEALAWAQDHAATTNIERVHVKHARPAPSRRPHTKKAHTIAKTGSKRKHAAAKRRATARRKR